MKSILFGALACLAAGCASAAVESAAGPGAMQTAATTELAAAGPAASDASEGNKRVCRKMAVMGTIMPKRVCATQTEWAATDAEALEQQEEFDRQRRSAGGARNFE